jgi:hypothetical protein
MRRVVRLNEEARRRIQKKMRELGRAPSGLHISDKSAFGERHDRGTTNDKVIENLHVQNRQSPLQLFGYQLIGLRRFGAPGRVVVDITFPESLCCRDDSVH